MWEYNCEVLRIPNNLIACELRASLYRNAFMNTGMACLSSVVRKMTAYQMKALLSWAGSLAICAKHISSLILLPVLYYFIFPPQAS